MAENACMLMREVQQCGFAVLETGLYLDTHPGDSRALAAFREYREKLKIAEAKYNECVGPLTLTAARAENKWDWVCTPWPWEG